MVFSLFSCQCLREAADGCWRAFASSGTTSAAGRRRANPAPSLLGGVPPRSPRSVAPAPGRSTSGSLAERLQEADHAQTQADEHDIAVQLAMIEQAYAPRVTDELDIAGAAGQAPRCNELEEFWLEDTLWQSRLEEEARAEQERRELHIAIQDGSEFAVRQLLHLRADANAADDAGISPLVNAVRMDRKQIIPLLQAHGAVDTAVQVKVEQAFNGTLLLERFFMASATISELKEELSTRICKQDEAKFVLQGGQDFIDDDVSLSALAPPQISHQKLDFLVVYSR